MFRFNKPATLFAFRALTCSAIAWLIAWQLGFGSPYWASITVWVVAQPSRGMTISKGIYRMLGTCLGALAAVLMIRFLAPWPWLVVLALALWCGICSAIANIVLYFRSYGAVLASFTAAIVALLAFTHPDHVYEVARERATCVLIGIVVAGLSSSFFTRSQTKQELFIKMRSAIATTMRWLSLVCNRASPQVKSALERQLVAEAEAIQELTDYASAESLQIRMRQGDVHNLLAALFSTLSSVRALDSFLERRPTLEVCALASLARDVEQRAKDAHDISLTALTSELERLESQFQDQQGLFVTRLEELRASLVRVEQQFDVLIKESQKSSKATHLSHHRDLPFARRAGIRAALAISIAGAIWLGSGWHGGPLLVMMAAVWCSVFGARPNPAAAMVTLLKSSAWAGLAALVTGQFLLSAHAPIWQSLVWQTIFLLPGALLTAVPSTALVGSLYTSNYILFLSPVHPMSFSLERFFLLSIGFFSGSLLSWAAFRLLVPATPDQPLENLRRKIVLDLQLLAKAGRRATRTEWETRTYHRLSRLITISSDDGRDSAPLVSGGMAALQIGRDLFKFNTSDPAALAPALTALATVSTDPEQTARRLRECANHLHASHSRDSDTLEEMANHISSHARFFRL